jgi:FkbM family methyltransferase
MKTRYLRVNIIFSIMDLDFIEIGTSSFETLCDTCSDNEIGMSVEPMKMYLDKLPNRPNVIKVNTAITSNRTTETIKMYYLSDKYIEDHDLSDGFRGLNNIYGIHPAIKNGYHEYFVEETMVPLMNIDELLLKYNICRIGFLKIDTEGHDCVILEGLFDYLVKKDKSYYPLKIQFESNHLTDPKIIDKTIENYTKIGYILQERDEDTILILK